MRNRPTWYVNSVKPKVNRSWTIPEKIRIYTMRTAADMAPQEIDDEMHATRTQIHNIVRMMRGAVDDKCFHCRTPLTDAEKAVKRATKRPRLMHLCFNCRNLTRDYKHELREKRIARGECGYCGKKPIVPGTKACAGCLSATHRRKQKSLFCGKCLKKSSCHGGDVPCEPTINQHSQRGAQWIGETFKSLT